MNLVRTLACAFILVACSRPPEDATPEGAVSLWLQRIDEARDDQEGAKARYELLGPGARERLEERSEKAGRSLGKRIDPSEMIGVGAAGVRFHPRTMKTEMHGDRATVVVSGNSPGDVARVETVRTAEGWRVEPDLSLSVQTNRDGG